MFNDWFTIGSITIHGYGVMIAIGILAAFFVGERQAKKHGLDPNQVDNLVFVCLASGFLGSKIVYCLTEFDRFLANPMMFFSLDGWVVYGGIIGGVLGAMAWCKYKKLNFKDYANMLFPEVALAQGFGRIGCFLAGCCYGMETHSHFGVTFPEGSLAPAGVSLIPTQLLSAFGDFVLFYILYKNYNSGKRPDLTAYLYLILYSVGRFMIEFLRGDEARGFVGSLSTSQFIAIFTCIAGIALLLLNRKEVKSESIEGE